jgi:hypothetical protein
MTFYFSPKTIREKITGLYMEINGGDINAVFFMTFEGTLLE